MVLPRSRLDHSVYVIHQSVLCAWGLVVLRLDVLTQLAVEKTEAGEADAAKAAKQSKLAKEAAEAIGISQPSSVAAKVMRSRRRTRCSRLSSA